MKYTPKFKKILDKIDKLVEADVPQEQIQETFKEEVLKLSKKERIQNLYKIRPKAAIPGKQERLMQFKLLPFQEHWFDNKAKKNLVLKMRQGGATTLFCLYQLDEALWNRQVNTVLMAHMVLNVKLYFRIIKGIFQQFQKDWGDLYPISAKYDNANELVINETESSCRVAMDAKGLTIDILHISEAAFIDDVKIEEALECVSSEGEVILETTANGVSGYFYNMWQNIAQGRLTSFKTFFYPWWWRYPEEGWVAPQVDNFVLTPQEQALMDREKLTLRHMIWKRIKLGDIRGSESRFATLYPEDSETCFLLGTDYYFDQMAVIETMRNTREPSFYGDLILEGKHVTFEPRQVMDKPELWCGLRIWEKPKDTHTYAIGVDTAEGVNKDASVAQVLDINTGVLVANYWGNAIDDISFAELIYKLGLYYNRATLCIEQNNTGNGVIAAISGGIGGLAYPNLYRRKVYDEFTQRETRQIGFKTTSSTKPRLLANLKKAHTNGEIVIKDRLTCGEFTLFRRDERTGKLGAIGSDHDDRIMALALAYEQYRLLEDSVKLSNSNTNYQPTKYDEMTGFPIS